ncbi:MAG: hypothetical protein APF84_01435 [Gracilibacter sp. BRH_c7a]|nr:MAG: hypothetical protein APF84_01435 [Gracilibacter sp. BRH_c7a]
MTVLSSKTTIGILGTAKGPHVKALTIALEGMGVKVKLIDPQKLTSYMPQSATFLAESREALDGQAQTPENIKNLDALLIRSLPGGSLEQVIYRMDVLHRLEKQGLMIINSPSLLEKTVDKFYTTALLADAGLPVPKTIVTERFDQAMEAVRKFGRVVVKPLFGSLGKGMVLIEDPDTAHRVFRALELGNYVYYLQGFLPHDNGDYRLFVVGGEVVSAMRRQSNYWKANIACGATAEPYHPDSVMTELAVRTADILQADYLGVDILISDGKPYLIEANGIPGWTGLQSVSNINIAEVIAKYVLRKIGRI